VTSPHLFISLGTSPAVVPEAFLLPEVEFAAVHAITTKNTSIAELTQWFAERAPEVPLEVTRVAGFSDFRSEADHEGFEEVLYRWLLESGVPPEARFVCLAGGFKTMSAAMQQAAAHLGAAEVFHVICNGEPPPCEAAALDDAIASGRVHWIRLGPQPGWPQFSALEARDYPLTAIEAVGIARSVKVKPPLLRQRVQDVLERSRRVDAAWDTLAELPFQTLATWSGPELAWLRGPLNAEGDADWIQALPKLELHCHLGGFATHGVLLDAVRAGACDRDSLKAIPAPAFPQNWPCPDSTISLEEYMKLGDANGSNLLKDPGCLRRQCELLYLHLLEQRVLYAEIRCSPGNYATASRSPFTVLSEIKETFDCCRKSAMADTAIVPTVNLLIIATRRESGDFRAAIARHLALAVTAAEHWTSDDECRVVGVDLAGFESPTTRAHYFREDFSAIHRCGLALTVHAGENDDAEGIWRAVFDLNARRLGHALHLADSPELLRSVADRRIAVEMCPFANLQIKGFALMPDAAKSELRRYPLKAYLDAGIRVTLNTDNIGISSASLSDNLLLAARLCPGLTRLEILQILANGLDAAFAHAKHRSRLHAAFDKDLPRPTHSS